MSTTGSLHRIDPGHEHWGDAVDLDLRYFPKPWTRPQWEDSDWEQNSLFGWMKLERLIGFALFFHLPGDPTAHLLKILMLPEQRQRGETVLFWRELSSSLKGAGAENVYLEVEEGNAPAIAFYEKIGFVKLRELRSYYSDGSNALAMSLTL